MLADHGRVQRDPAVGGVQGLPPLPRLRIDLAALANEGRNIRDRVPHPVALPRALEVQCLVEVRRALGVDRDEGHGRLVGLGELGGVDGLLRLGLDRGRERLRQVEVLPDQPESVGEELGRIREPRDDDPLARIRASQWVRS